MAILCLVAVAIVGSAALDTAAPTIRPLCVGTPLNPCRN